MIKLLKDITTNITDKDVYLVDDIYDSGNTMNFLIDHLQQYNPKSITPVTLFKKYYSNFIFKRCILIECLASNKTH